MSYPRPDLSPKPSRSTDGVGTPGMMANVPNAPKTKVRGFRIPDDIYAAAVAKAADRGETLTSVVIAAFERYAKRKDRPSTDD